MKQKKLLALVILVVGASFIYVTIQSFLRVGHKPSPKQPTLTIYTYSSFSYSLGPGPSLAMAFRKTCNCKVEFKGMKEAGLLLSTLKLNSQDVDLIIGLDQNNLPQAQSEFQWEEVNTQDIAFEKAIAEKRTEQFIPYNWSPMTFIYRKSKYGENLSLENILDKKYEISVQDPRTSTPGQELLRWIFSWQGNPEENLRAFKENIYNVSPSWTGAYGLFQKKQVDIVFSYLTSLAYHLKEEKDTSYAAVKSAKGHPVQIEYAAIPKTCKNCQLAKKFVRFMLSQKAQNYIMNKNYMFPVVDDVVDGTVFESLPALPSLDQKSHSEFLDNKTKALELWKKIVQI